MFRPKTCLVVVIVVVVVVAVVVVDMVVVVVVVVVVAVAVAVVVVVVLFPALLSHMFPTSLLHRYGTDPSLAWQADYVMGPDATNYELLRSGGSHGDMKLGTYTHAN